jgi:hypothetical protein
MYYNQEKISQDQRRSLKKLDVYKAPKIPVHAGTDMVSVSGSDFNRRDRCARGTSEDEGEAG